MNRSIRPMVLLAILAVPAAAQAQSPQPTQLNDQFEANDFFAARLREIWRANADRLSAIDQEYSDAVAALGAENSSRLQTLLEANSAAHRELSAQGERGDAYTEQYNRIQSETQQGRADLLVWRQERRQELDNNYRSRRAAQFAAAEELVAGAQELRQATLQRLVNGPVAVSSLPPLSLPGPDVPAPATRSTTGVLADSSAGPTARGGVDLGGAVPLGSAGDEVVAGSATQQQRNERLAGAEPATTAQVAELPQSRINQQLRRDCSTNPDADGDGDVDAACGGSDCNDGDPDRYFGNTEVPDAANKDEDCDPSTLGGIDADGDGFISAAACNSVGGDLICGRDCDDTRASVYPGAPEICNYIDDNSDADTDEGVLATKFLNRDGDLHGDPDKSLLVCPQTSQSPYGGGSVIWLSTVGNDCDDADPEVWLCDNAQ